MDDIRMQPSEVLPVVIGNDEAINTFPSYPGWDDRDGSGVFVRYG